MKRTKQHVIDTKAQSLFRQSLPAEWIVRSMTPDYGIDYEVEIVEGESPTGFTFYVQLKGTQSPKYEDVTLCLPFDVDKLSHYSEKVNRPVVILVADLANEVCLWLYSQRFIRKVLRVSKPRWYSQKSVTLYIPKVNKLPKTWESLSQVVKEGSREEFIKQFGRPPLRLALEIEDKLGNPAAIAAAIRQNDFESASVRLDLVEACLEANDRERALQELENLFVNTKDSGMAEIHIASATRLVQELGIFKPTVFERCANILDQALSRADECVQKRVVLIAKSTRALLVLLHSFRCVRESELFIDIAKRSRSGIDVMLKLQQSQHWIDFQAADDSLRLLIHESVESNEIKATCNITAMLAQAYSIIYLIVRSREGTETSTPIATSAEQLLEYAEKLAISIDDSGLRCFVMQIKAQLQFATRDKDYEATLSEMKSIALIAKLRSFVRAADALLQLMKSNEDILEEKSSPDENQTPLSLEEEASTIRLVAEMTGVNLKEDDDPIAQTINLAIRDLNPERILKFCEHLHVLYTSTGGIYAQLYGLDSAGGKLVYCEIKDKAIKGMQFDGILEIFKWRFCKGCKSQSPRPETWHWTREWQKELLANIPEGLHRYLRQSSKQ